jgi:hypothetical protein
MCLYLFGGEIMQSKPINKNHHNRLVDGRGQGRGKEYVPFIQANDNKVASEGWLTRTIGWKAERIHHTLSRHEYEYLLVQEWSDIIVETREQYPLSFELTQKIASKLNIVHPFHDGGDVVMSTDFMHSYYNKHGELVDEPRTVKPVSKLSKRTIELFEIERRYYKELGMTWKIIYDTPKPVNLIQNIDWLYDAKRLNRPGIDADVVKLVQEPLLNMLMELGLKHSISKACLMADSKLGLENGSSMFIMKHMLANKMWVTDMNQLIRESKPLAIRGDERIMEAQWRQIV